MRIGNCRHKLFTLHNDNEQLKLRKLLSSLIVWPSIGRGRYMPLAATRLGRNDGTTVLYDICVGVVKRKRRLKAVEILRVVVCKCCGISF